MKKFLALYIGTPEGRVRAGWDDMDDAGRESRQKEAFDAWAAWGSAHAVNIVDGGAPVGRTKRAGPDGIADIRNAITAYTIVEAEDHDAAARMFENHPHFTLFPGDSVEIMEILPMPER